MNLIKKLKNRHVKKQEQKLEKIKLMNEIEKARRLNQEKTENEKKYEEDILRDLLDPKLEGVHFVKEKDEITFVD